MPQTDLPPPIADAPESVAAPKPATLLQVAGAVFWSFFGIRKDRHMRQDAVTIKPLQVVVVGVLLAAVLVFALIGLVRFITRGIA